MSVFNPMSFDGQPDQKRALLERLMQQYQEAASRSAGLAQSVGGATPFRMAHQFGGMGLHVGRPPVLPSSLIAQLGPGAINANGGHAHGFQPGPEQPHAGGNPAAPGGPAHSIPSAPSAPAQAVTAAAPASAPSNPAAAVANAAGGITGGSAAGGTFVDPASAVANANRLGQLHPQVVQRILGIYASPYHAHVGL